MNDTYTTGQAARPLGVSATYVLDLIHRGRLVAERTPLGWLVDGSDLLRLRRERAQKEKNSVKYDREGTK